MFYHDHSILHLFDPDMQCFLYMTFLSLFYMEMH